MAEQKVLVCDVCREPDAIEVTIIIGGTAWKADLCLEHRGPLNAILVHARESRLPARTGGAYEKVSLHHLMELTRPRGG